MNVKNGKESFDSVMTNPVSLEFYNEKKLSARGMVYKSPLAYLRCSLDSPGFVIVRTKDG